MDAAEPKFQDLLACANNQEIMSQLDT
jgi:serum/glucocorticoid-regulated kinase 2